MLSKIVRPSVLIAISIWCGANALSQTELPNALPRQNLRLGRPLALGKTHYRMPAGGTVTIDGPLESRDFVRHAKTLRVSRIDETGVGGFVVGPDTTGEIVLAASLRVPQGEYQVSISAVNAAGEDVKAK